MLESDLLQLNARVIYLKAAPHNVAEVFQNLMPVIAAANHGMAAHGMDS